MEICQSSEFEVELARRTLVSEQRRAEILGWVLSVLALVVLCRSVIGNSRSDSFPGYGWIAVITGIGCAYEWLASRIFAWAIRRNKQPARFRFYINALI
jgi:hypothetical protein